MSSTPEQARTPIEAIHWATEELLTQMAKEVMSDDGYAVYLRFVKTREGVRRRACGDDA